MTTKFKKIIKWWLSDKNIHFSDNELELFNRRSFKRFKQIFKKIQPYLVNNLEHHNISDINSLWKMNIVFSRLVFKYSLFAENYIESALENIIYSPNLEQRKQKFYDLITYKIKDISTFSNKHQNKFNKLIFEIRTIKNFLVDGDFTEIKLSQKIIIYKYLINNDDQFKLPINELDKIRTLRNKAAHHDFLLDHFFENKLSINLLRNLIDENIEMNLIMREYA